MVDMAVPRLPRLRMIAGARVEHSDLQVRSFDPQGRDTTSGPRNTDVLPSLSLSYALSETQSLRVSATRTLSRPEYRELSPIAYADEGGDNELRGNPGLVRALIDTPDPTAVIARPPAPARFPDGTRVKADGTRVRADGTRVKPDPDR